MPWLLAAVVISAIIWYEIPGSKTGPAEQSAFPEKWHFATAGAVTGALALGGDGTVYATSLGGFVYALDPTGKLRWKFEAGPLMAGPVVGEDGTIFVSNAKQEIFAIDHSGAQQWKVGGGPYADLYTGNTAAAVDAYYLYTFWRGSLRALKVSSGEAAWTAGIGFTNGGSVSILSGGLVVYPGVGRVDAVDSDGRTSWQYPAIDPPLTVDYLMQHGGHPPTGNFWLESGIAVALDGTLYAGAATSRMVALSSGGRLLWEFKTKPGVINRATPVIADDGSIFFGSGDGSLYALNSDGTQKWAVDTGGSIVATPLLAADGTIYVANNGELIAMSREGKILARVALQAPVESAPTLAPDGTVYVATRSGQITAFAGNHGGLMNSAWPKFQAGLRNSGLARSF